MRVSRPVLRERGGEIPLRYSPSIDQGFVELEQRRRLEHRRELRIRCGLMNSVVSPSTKRSSVVRFGARCQERLLICS